MKKWQSLVLLVVLMVVLPMCAMALEPVKITSTTDNGDGTVTITWDNPNSGTVTVGSLVWQNQESGNMIIPEFEVSGNTYTFNNLAPGMEYALLVMPDVELDYADMVTVRVQDVPEFDEFQFRMKDANLTYFVPTEENYSYNYTTNTNNDKIYELLDEKQFWMKIDFGHQNRSTTIVVPILTVVTSPTGFVWAVPDEVELTKNTIGFWRTMVYMNDAFQMMHDASGEIPTGEYSVKVYLKGKFVGEDTFVIKP